MRGLIVFVRGFFLLLNFLFMAAIAAAGGALALKGAGPVRPLGALILFFSVFSVWKLYRRGEALWLFAKDPRPVGLRDIIAASFPVLVLGMGLFFLWTTQPFWDNAQRFVQSDKTKIKRLAGGAWSLLTSSTSLTDVSALFSGPNENDRRAAARRLALKLGEADPRFRALAEQADPNQPLDRSTICGLVGLLDGDDPQARRALNDAFGRMNIPPAQWEAEIAACRDRR